MKFIFGFVLTIALVLNFVECNKKTYRGYKVYRVEFTTDNQFDLLYNLKINSQQVSFWQLSRSQHFADIMVSPEKQQSFLAYLKANNFTYNVQIEDLEKTLEIFVKLTQETSEVML